MKRLDVLIAETGLVKSREAGKEHIKNGMVRVDGRVCTKPSELVAEDAAVEVDSGSFYVGRGGIKLSKAVEAFGICLDGAVCLDIGASTGGFTDCMLKNGASKVYAVDVGHGQLDESLANDSRVVNLEGTDIRSIDKDFFGEKIDFISIDVSFISLKQILPSAKMFLKDGGTAVALIKPQFEAGRSNLNKNGVVKSPKVHKAVLDDISRFTGGLFAVRGITFSPVARKDGNIEYLIYLEKGGEPVGTDIADIVEAAFREVKFDL